MSALAMSLSDTLVLARRNLTRIPRQPDLLIAYTIQPVMFVLLFVYVFGGAIQTPGFDYVDFLMPGIIVQSISFGGFATALGLVRGRQEGPDRPLPLAADVARRGARGPHVLRRAAQLPVARRAARASASSPASTSSTRASARSSLGIVLLLLLGYAFSWIFALVGLFSSSPETANAIGFTLIFPLTFASSVFVPVGSMPDGLRQFARGQPVHDVVRRDALAVAGHAGPHGRLDVVRLVRGADRRLRAAGRRALPARSRRASALRARDRAHALHQAVDVAGVVVVHRARRGRRRRARGRAACDSSRA